MTITATPAGQGTKGSASPASYLETLIAEREPSIEKLVAERDPKALDSEFYSGLFMRLQVEVKREMALEKLRRETHMYERRIRREAR